MCRWRAAESHKADVPATNFCLWTNRHSFCKRILLCLGATYGALKEESQSSFLFLIVPSKNVCHFMQAIFHVLFPAQQNASIILHYWHHYYFKESCFRQLGTLGVAKGWRKRFVCSFFVHTLFCLRPVNSKFELTRFWDHLEAMCKKVCAIALTAEAWKGKKKKKTNETVKKEGKKASTCVWWYLKGTVNTSSFILFLPLSLSLSLHSLQLYSFLPLSLYDTVWE